MGSQGKGPISFAVFAQGLHNCAEGQSVSSMFQLGKPSE